MSSKCRLCLSAPALLFLNPCWWWDSKSDFHTQIGAQLLHLMCSTKDRSSRAAAHSLISKFPQFIEAQWPYIEDRVVSNRFHSPVNHARDFSFGWREKWETKTLFGSLHSQAPGSFLGFAVKVSKRSPTIDYASMAQAMSGQEETWQGIHVRRLWCDFCHEQQMPEKPGAPHDKAYWTHWHTHQLGGGSFSFTRPLHPSR